MPRHLHHHMVITRHACLHILRLIAGTALAVGLTLNAIAADNPPSDCRDMPSLEGQALFDFVETRSQVDFSVYEGYTIGKIEYRVLPIFNEQDPDENNWLFRTANWLHINTKHKTLKKQMIISSGEPLQRQTLTENERILRNNNYLVDAMVLPHRICGETLDLLVVVRDIWTFTPSASASRSGGEESTGAGITENNLFGSGQRISMGYFEDEHRNGTTFGYRNSLLPHRLSMRLSLADNSDGEVLAGSLTRPFYELDSVWSAGISAASETLTETIEENDQQINKFKQTSEHYEGFLGWSPGRKNDAVHRWTIGITEKENRFEVILDETALLPASERLVYPWVGWEYLQDNYATADNINRSHRQEDIQLGFSHQIRLGYAGEDWGSDENAFVFNATSTYSVYLNNYHLIRTAIGTSGQRNNLAVKNTFLSAAVNYYYFISQKSRWFLKLNLDGARNIRQDQQLTIGGDDNLRGYPRDYQRGNRRWVFSMERRRFTNWHLFNLAYVGGAAYIDTGRVWNTATSRDEDTDTLANIGLGLRFSPSKFRVDKILHVDIAAPVVNVDEVDDYQLILSGRVEF